MSYLILPIVMIGIAYTYSTLLHVNNNKTLLAQIHKTERRRSLIR